MPSFTPLVEKVGEGSFVLFPSALEDINLNIGLSSTKKVQVSKYALLNIPAMTTPTNGNNNIQFNNIESTFLEGLSVATDSGRIDLSESLQNYVLNLDTLITSGQDYDLTQDLNVSERVFWKWMKEIGAVRFRNATNMESAVDDRYVEEDDNSNISGGDYYSRVVQCIGEIDMQGQNLTSNKNIFKQIYFYLPSQKGTSPKVLFKSVSDVNYYENQIIKSESAGNEEYILGQTHLTPLSLAGLRTKAFYDYEVPLGGVGYEVDGNISNDIWFANRSSFNPPAYFTDQVFTNPASQTITRTDVDNPAHNVTYKRSMLDGIMIDFEPLNYKDIASSNGVMSTLNDYNTSTPAQSFFFNAMLIYYDVIDPRTNVVTATNLLGVYILNDVKVINIGATQIEQFKKWKQDNTIAQQGNGYGVRLNLKLDASADQVTPKFEVSVNDYNTFSMQLFSEAMNQMIESNRHFELMMKQNSDLLQQVSNLRTLLQQTGVDDYATQIAQLEEAVLATQNQQGILDLYGGLQRQINEILSGNTTVNMSLALDLAPMDGLGLQLQGNQLVFRNNRQRFTSSSQINLYVGVNDPLILRNSVYLSNADTLYYHKAAGQSLVAADDIYLYIVDGATGWKTNQAFTICFSDMIDFNNFGMAIYTDSNNEFMNAKPFQMPVAFITPEKLQNASSITVVCVNAETYQFVVI